MAGQSNDSNPEPACASVSVWLGRQPLEPYDFPDWLGEYEREKAAGMATGQLMEYVHSRWLIRQSLYGARSSVAGLRPGNRTGCCPNPVKRPS